MTVDPEDEESAMSRIQRYFAFVFFYIPVLWGFSSASVQFAKTTIRPESKVELERLVAILNQYPKMEIEIAGHTDNVGGDRPNQVLSEGRATAILQYLLDRGVGSARLRAKGYGESMPVVPNDTDEHRQLNSRVEFVILKME